MGLDSRDYMVEDEDEAARPGGISVVWHLIIINAIVWGLWQVEAFTPFLAEHFRVSFDGLAERKQLWTLITSAFSHRSLMHLFWNMLFLFMTGRLIEELRGGRALLATYLLGAIGGSLGHAALSSALNDPGSPALGASGAVMATLVAATVLAPNRRVVLLGLVPVPMWGLTGAFLIGDLLSLARTTVSGLDDSISHGGHLGGALTGLVFAYVALRRRVPAGVRPRTKQLGALDRLRTMLTPRPRLRVLPPIERALELDPEDDAVVAGVVDPATAERVDDLLRKIHDGGIACLTPEEKSFLERASTRYRK